MNLVPNSQVTSFKKIFFDFFLSVSLILFGFLFYSSPIQAQDNAIPPPYVPCNVYSPNYPGMPGYNPLMPIKTSDEFNSLRPYQASPCDTGLVPSAKFCGNDLTLHDIVSVYYPGSENLLTGAGCVTTGNTVNCSYKVPVSEPLTIDMGGAKLPFMGNTEDVVNSQKSTSSLSDADQVNGYVSSYLNGTVNHAESAPLDVGDDCIGVATQRPGVCSNLLLGICPSRTLIAVPDLFLTPDGTSSCGGVKSCCVSTNPLAEKVTTLDRDKLINYSGPINKLLPQEVAQQERAQSVKDAVASLPTVPNPILPLGGAGIRHDQVVGCVYGIKVTIPFLVNTVIGGFPGPCYESGLMSIIPRVQMRLDQWKSHLPPERANFPDYIEYEKALETWRGKGCAMFEIPPYLDIPILGRKYIPVVGGKGIILCYDDPLNPNYYATLYPYIPLSSTEDLEGSMSIDKESSVTSPTIQGVTVNGVGFSNQTPSTLFFPHLQETSELATSLQNTFVAKSEEPNETAAPTNVSTTSCNTVEVRSNKGDSLFATKLSGNLKYTASFSCQFNPRTTTTNPICLQQCLAHSSNPSTCTAQCTITTLTQTCTKDVFISLSTTGSIPKIDSIWSQLVAGPESIFKRIFPKTNTDGGVGKIIDIPASTSITYTLNSGKGVGQQNADLKFPHIGGIGEYFLKGIQTALRPKGYGDPIEFDPNSPDDKTADICSMKCNPDPTKVDMAGVKQRFIDLANKWFGAAGKPRVDMYDTVVNSAIARGVDPIFALENWLNESGASNYKEICAVLGGGDPGSQYCQQVLDFGVLDQNIITTFNPDGTIIADHLLGQLNEFLNLSYAYISYCGHVNKCDLETWGAMFTVGQCQALPQGNAHMVSAMQIYSWLAPKGQLFPCYPAKVP
jgi:hypothetical protein